MPNSSLMPAPKQQYFDANGAPLVGGKVYTYAAGTNTPKVTYTDYAGTIPQANPIILNVRGEAATAIFWNGSYKVEVRDAQDNLVYTVDNYNTDPFGFASSITTLIANLASSIGASLIGFIQSGAGAVLRTLEAKGRDVKNMADWGVVGDGVTNDTTKWQKAIDTVSASGGGIIYANYGTYLLNKWFMRSNVTLIMCPGSTLQCVNNSLGVNERFINIDGISNWGIEGNWARARMNKEYASGEQRHIVFMVDAHNGFIRNFKANDSGGDGYYIGRNAPGTHCTDILLDNCFADNNRRNNGSVVSCNGITVRGGVYSNANGTDPQYGWDVEPNDSDDVLENINFIGVKTKGNAKGGFIVALSNFVLTADRNTSVSFIGCKSEKDNSSKSSGNCALRIAGTGSPWANTLHGQITVMDFDAIEPEATGIGIHDWDYLKGAHISISHARIVKPNFSNAMVQPFDRAGVCALNFGGAVTVGNFALNDIRTSGVNHYVGFSVYDSGGAIRNFSANDVICDSIGSSGVKNYRSEAGPNQNSSISYSIEQIVSLAASGGVRQYPGEIIETPAGGAFTLDVNAADSIGQVFMFRNPVVNTSQIVPSGTDLIMGWSVGTGANGALIMNRAGDFVKLRGTAQGWAPESISHYAQRPIATNTTVPRKLVWAIAPPASGTWEQGDRAVNALATIGQPKAWVCTVSGAPGTWVSEGNL